MNGSDLMHKKTKRLTARLIAFLAALTVSAGALSGCSGDKPTAEAADKPETSAAVTTVETEAETVTTTLPDVFGEDYDPFAEDYDPYGNGSKKPSAKPAGTISTDSEETEGTTTVTENTTEKPQTTTAQKPQETQATSQKPAETTAAATTEKPAQQTSSADVYLEVNNSNGWENGSDKFSQIDLNVVNNSDKTISNWKAVIPVANGAQIEQNWNCELSISGGKLTATPVEHNKNVEPGQSGTCGFILKNAGTPDASKSTVTYTAGAAQQNWGGGSNNGNSGNNQGVGNNSTPIVAAKDVPKPTTDDWLYVKGNKIVDSSGKEVWLTGCNWFGYNTGTNTFDGLWACDLNTSLASIADHGFNLLRVPISTELLKKWSNGEYPTANFNQATNSYLVGMNSLEIFDYVIGQCRANGIKIMIDIHCAKTDSMGHMKNMWYDGSITEDDYIKTLGWIAKRYANDDTIIAYDLENEPHGKPYESEKAIWNGSTSSNNWKYIAEKAAKSVLANNPNVLVMVEGIEIYPKDIKSNGNFTSTNDGDYYFNWWGGNLRGVKDYPVDLGKYQNKLVYSPHDYGPAVYKQPWFQDGYNFDSLYKDCWYDNWFYIQKEGIAPLLIGEWGGYMTQPNLTWMTHLRKLIKDNRINHTFWCFNANSGDTGGLVKDDFVTWDTEKYNFVKEVLWQQDGKFVGLDHQIPLGKNGITLSDAN